MWPENSVQVLFNSQRILCKKESEEASMLIWTNLYSFAITSDISRSFQTFHFPIEVLLKFLQTQKGLN